MDITLDFHDIRFGLYMYITAGKPIKSLVNKSVNENSL